MIVNDWVKLALRCVHCTHHSVPLFPALKIGYEYDFFLQFWTNIYQWCSCLYAVTTVAIFVATDCKIRFMLVERQSIEQWKHKFEQILKRNRFFGFCVCRRAKPFVKSQSFEKNSYLWCRQQQTNGWRKNI